MGGVLADGVLCRPLVRGTALLFKCTGTGYLLSLQGWVLRSRCMERNIAMTDVFYELTCIRWWSTALLSLFFFFLRS